MKGGVGGRTGQAAAAVWKGGAAVLADHDILEVDGADVAQQLHLLVADVLCAEAHRALHRKKRQDLCAAACDCLVASSTKIWAPPHMH